MSAEVHVGHIISRDALPEGFPTHKHNAAFWEALGRSVATFGFLEDVLCKAIFAFTATTKYQESEIEKAYNNWLPTLERALADPLGKLIDAYGKSVRNNSDATIKNLDELLEDLRNVSKIRNVICHGFWGGPDAKSATVPSFVNNQKEVFETPIDKVFLNQLQKHTCELACTVIVVV